MLSLRRRTAGLVGIAALAVVLVAAGFRPDGLPWPPGSPYSDAATSHYPAARFLRESVWADHEFPLWRESFMGGAPFAANPLNKTAYPLQWLDLLTEPLLFLNLMLIGHLAMAGAGMWAWSKALGLNDGGALISALAWMLAPRVLSGVGVGHFDLIYASAWWPWLMWSAMRLGAAPSLRDGLQTTLFGGLLVAADVRLALFALPAALVAFLVTWNRAGREWRHLAAGALAAALVVGLSVAVIAPLLGWSPWLNRGEQTAAIAAAYSLQPGNLLGMMIPLSTGSHESLTYLGLVTALLAGIGVWSLPSRWRLAALAVFAAIVLWAFGPFGLVWPLLAGQGGVLAWFRVPARIWYLVALLAAPLAGFGSQVFIEAVSNPQSGLWRRRRMYRLAAFGLVISAVLTGVALIAIPAARMVGVQFLFVGVLLGGLILVVLAGKLSGQLLWVALIVVVVLDAALGTRAWAEWRPLSDHITASSPLTDALKAARAELVYSPDYSLPQEAADTAGIRLLGGVDPFQIAAVTRSIREAGGVETTGYDVVVPPLTENSAYPNAGLLADWGVTHVVAAVPVIAEGLEPETTIGDVTIYRNARLVSSGTDDLDRWPSLSDGPDEETIAELGQISLTSWAISMLLFAGVLAALLLVTALSRKRKMT